MNDQSHPGLVSSLRTLSRAAGVLVAMIGGLVVIGWAFGIAVLKSGLVGLVTIFSALVWWSARSLNRCDAKRRQAEEKVRASEEKFRAVAQTANDAIISADSHGNIIYFNARAEQMFG